jgi:hypothetical protein
MPQLLFNDHDGREYLFTGFSRFEGCLEARRIYEEGAESFLAVGGRGRDRTEGNACWLKAMFLTPSLNVNGDI